MAMELPGEEWRPVVGHEGLYDVSSLGRVRSYYVRNARGRLSASPQSICAPVFDESSRGVCYYRLSLCRNGIHTKHRVHSLVAMSFLGPGQDGQVVRHRDGDTTNNTPTNLLWGTPTDNAQDTARHGRAAKKLTEQDVVEIRRRYVGGELGRELAVAFDVGENYIYRVLRGVQWGHVPGVVPREIRHFRRGSLTQSWTAAGCGSE